MFYDGFPKVWSVHNGEKNKRIFLSCMVVGYEELAMVKFVSPFQFNHKTGCCYFSGEPVKSTVSTSN
jgi:hypothetical protein